MVGERGTPRWRWLLARHTKRLHHGFTVSHMPSVSRRHTANIGGLRRGKMLAETLGNLCNSRNSHRSWIIHLTKLVVRNQLHNVE
jgi:hypothetical protein